MKHHPTFWSLLLPAVIAGMLPSVLLALGPDRSQRVDDSIRYAQQLSSAFERVADHIKPSVVTITSVRRITPTRIRPQLPEQFQQSPFRQFFGEDFFDRFFGGRVPEQGFAQQGLGTGVIVSDDGYVVTNHHVIGDADEVQVKLPDGRTYDAHIVGSDDKTDLAVIRIDADGLQAADLGDSDAVRIGEWVVAAGNPFNLAQTITAGIVSAKGRAHVGIADYEDFIQTDAAINPGNSGGPLVNLQGEVIGINTAIATSNGGYMGVGFAIPINMAKSIMDSLIKTGHVVRGWLGVLIQPLDDGLAASFGFSGTEGALVGDVTPDSPADNAGIRQGDIIVKIDGSPVHNVDQLHNGVASLAPGTKVVVTVFRDHRLRDLQVEIGQLESQVASAQQRGSFTDLGLVLNTLTPEEARNLGYEHVAGVLVVKVDPLGLAARAGIQVNDVILSIQGRSVRTVGEFEQALRQQGLDKGVRLVIQSGAMQRFVFISSPT